MEKKDIKKEIVQCSLAYILLSGSGGLVNQVNMEAVESPVLKRALAKVQPYFSAEGEYKPTTTTYNDSDESGRINHVRKYNECFCPEHEKCFGRYDRSV